MVDDGFNDLLENVIFLFVGAFAGWLADAERRRRMLAQAAAAQLAVSNTAPNASRPRRAHARLDRVDPRKY